MSRRIPPRRSAVSSALITAAAVAAVIVPGASASVSADAGPVQATVGITPTAAIERPPYPVNWRPTARLTRDCVVYWNYPSGSVQRRTRTLHQGDTVNIRYNVNGRAVRDPVDHHITYTGYALVQVKPHTVNPHWGFVHRSCLSRQLPLPNKHGVGGHGTPRKLNFNPVGNGRRGGARLHVSGNPTLRDRPRAFVIGNLDASHGDVFLIGSAVCRVASGKSWVHGYAPAAHRWGYVQASHLPGCQMARAAATPPAAGSGNPATHPAAPPRSASPTADSRTAPAARPTSCTTSSFKVVWSVAGMYTRPDGAVFEDKHYGNRVTGRTGTTSAGWTQVYTANLNPDTLLHIGYMKDAALTYLGCD
jgi:hypothetical protein